MSTTRRTIVSWPALVALLLATLAAHADTKDGKPWDWEAQERARTSNESSSTCAALNTRLGAQITCKIDHASFDNHLAKEIAKTDVRQRDDNAPATYCGELAWYFLSGQESLMTFPDAQECPKCADELKQRVKTLECRFAEDDGKPSVAFDTHETTRLVVTMRRGDMGASNWMRVALAKILPVYAAYRTEHHR
jgi:hypothetical protein